MDTPSPFTVCPPPAPPEPVSPPAQPGHISFLVAPEQQYARHHNEKMARVVTAQQFVLGLHPLMTIGEAQGRFKGKVTIRAATPNEADAFNAACDVLCLYFKEGV